MFTSKEDALKFLRSCDKVIVPKLYTYWSHSSQYKTGVTTSTRRGLWDALPSQQFKVKSEMSYLDVGLRLQEVGKNQDFKSVQTVYAPDSKASNLKGFQIKVVMPKRNLSKEEFSSLGMNEESVSKFYRENRGLGDGRHPKLSGNTQVHIFGYMDKDEMSGKEVDTVIGVRDEDLIVYANNVQKEMQEIMTSKGKIEDSTYEMPKSREDAYTVANKKETFVLGDNGWQNNFDKTSQLKNKIIDRYNSIKDSTVHTYKSLEEKQKDMLEYPGKQFISNSTSGVVCENGITSFARFNSSSGQKRALNYVQDDVQKLIDSIEYRHNQSPLEGNNIQYEIRDFCKLEILNLVVPKMQQRVEDLGIYEKFIGEFQTNTTTSVTEKKGGLLGLIGQTTTSTRWRNFTQSEFEARKNNDLSKISQAFFEGKISQRDLVACEESIRRLYDEEIKVLEEQKTIQNSDEKTEAGDINQESTAEKSNTAKFNKAEKTEFGSTISQDRFGDKNHDYPSKNDSLEVNFAKNPQTFIRASQIIAEEKAQNGDAGIYKKLKNLITGAFGRIKEFNQKMKVVGVEKPKEQEFASEQRMQLGE